MSSKFNQIIRRFTSAMKASQEKKTSAYDTAAKVLRIEDGVAWVHIPGGVDETPVRLTVNAKEGDEVQVRVSGGDAFLIGNSSAPPTDDRMANIAMATADTTDKEVKIIAEKIIEAYDAILRRATIGQLNAESAILNKAIIGTGSADDFSAAKLSFLEAAGRIFSADQLTALSAAFDTATAGTISADDIQAARAQFESLLAGSFSATEIVAASAEFKTAVVSQLYVNSLRAGYAEIDFANVTTEAVKNLFVNVGMIENATIHEGRITGTLSGVTVVADLIQANAIVTGDLIVQDSENEGVYYKINPTASGLTIDELETLEYDKFVSGQYIVAKSITADQIAVTELAAFGATIAGLQLENGKIYTAGKSTAGSQAPGIYMDSRGQFVTGSDYNFIASWYDTEAGKWKIAIRADEISFGTGESVVEVITNAAEAVENMQERMDSGEFKGEKGDKGDTGPQGPQGIQGATGPQGVSVTNVTSTNNTADGGTSVITVTLSDGTTKTFNVKNGNKGSTGDTAQWFYGTALTHTSGTATASISGAVVGSMYLNVNTSLVYKCTAISGSTMTWTYAGDLTKGVIDNIDVGGRNLLLNTDDLTKWNKESGITVEWDSGVGMYKIIDTTHSSSRWGIYQDIPCEPNTAYTCSVEGLNGDTSLGLGLQSYAGSASWSTKKASSSNTKSRISATITTGSDHTVIRVYLQHSATSINQYYYAHRPKLEKGNIPTDWTPAPEDVDAAVAAAQDTADIAQTTADSAQQTADSVSSQAAQNSEAIRVQGLSLEAFRDEIRLAVAALANGTQIFKGDPLEDYQSEEIPTLLNYPTFTDFFIWSKCSTTLYCSDSLICGTNNYAAHKDEIVLCTTYNNFYQFRKDSGNNYSWVQMTAAEIEELSNRYAYVSVDEDGVTIRASKNNQTGQLRVTSAGVVPSRIFCC